MDAKTIKDLRAETGLSQSQFAQSFGIPVRTIQKWECGESSPKPYVLRMMQEILKQKQLGYVAEASEKTME